MIDISDLVLRLRLIYQDLWNNYCWRSSDLREVAVLDDFEELRLALYKFFVLDSLVQGGSRPTRMFGPGFYLLPRRYGNSDGCTSRLRILIRGAQAWKEEVCEVSETDIMFQLTDFFDWHLFFWRDFRFFKAKVLRWDSNQEAVGSEILLNALEMSVFFDSGLYEE